MQGAVAWRQNINIQIFRILHILFGRVTSYRQYNNIQLDIYLLNNRVVSVDILMGLHSFPVVFMFLLSLKKRGKTCNSCGFMFDFKVKFLHRISYCQVSKGQFFSFRASFLSSPSFHYPPDLCSLVWHMCNMFVGLFYWSENQLCTNLKTYRTFILIGIAMLVWRNGEKLRASKYQRLGNQVNIDCVKCNLWLLLGESHHIRIHTVLFL